MFSCISRWIDGVGSFEKTSKAAYANFFFSKENIKKSTINILRRSYLQQFLSDMKKEMTYKRSSQFVSNNLIRTENTKLTN